MPGVLNNAPAAFLRVSFFAGEPAGSVFKSGARIAVNEKGAVYGRL